VLAPPEQTHVPMLFWASDNFYTSQGIDEPCVEDATNAEYSHDAIFHTLLPIFGIETSVYRRELDLFASCRVERSQRPLPQHSTRAQPATETSSATAIAAVRD
jgi:glucan phosphoethanolaminetransferase (alkaline phosphatase superfamily)